MELRIGYADKIGGEPTDYFILNLSKTQLKVIYGALLKERNTTGSLIRHYQANPTDTDSPAREKIKKEHKEIEKLISLISQVL